MALSLKLLGEFELHDEAGAALSLPTRKTRGLLGYLAVNADRPQPRERLMALLWSDRGERQARQSLNQALLSIRKLADSEALLDSDGERVTLRSEAVDCDVAKLRSLIENDPASAATIYEGPFLDGLLVPDPAFEEWLLATRSELHAQVCDALATAADGDDLSLAIDSARRLVTLDPLREDAHRRLMELLHKSGDRAGALRQYQACAEVLQRDLQVEPDVATKALYEAIRQGTGAARAEVQSPAVDHALPNPPEELTPGTTESESRAAPWPNSWLVAIAAAGVLLVVGSGITLWLASWNATNETESEHETSLPLPDKPSIAVLPFTNLSGDPAQEYFSDGITGDLITDLSKVSGLFVIARNASFAYKGRTVHPRDIGRELGVRYLLEGSVRRSGDRVRINAQFIDAKTGGHLWAERFDHKLEDVFALQDAVTQKIVSALAVTLKPSEAQHRNRKAKIDPEAYDYFLRGLERLRRYTPETNAEARQYFHQAVNLDPRFARAVAAIGFTHAIDIFLGVQIDRAKTLDLANRYVTAALEIDDSSPAVYVALSSVNQFLGNYEQAVQAARRAIEIDANYADGYSAVAGSSIRAGRAKDALEAIQKALRLDPQRPAFYLTNLGGAYFMLGRYDEAVSALREAVAKNPTFIVARRWLAASYAHLDKLEEAEWEAAEILAYQPDFSLRKAQQIYEFRRKEDIERYIEGLRKAGIPE